MTDHARNPGVATVAARRLRGSGPPRRPHTTFALPRRHAAGAAIAGFAKSESGAVTVDYVPIIAAAVGLGLAVASTVNGGLGDVSGRIESSLADYKISTSFDALKAIEDTAYLFEDTETVDAEAEVLDDSELAALLSDEEVKSLLEDVSADGSDDGSDDGSSGEADSASTESADSPPSALGGSGKSDKTSSSGSGKKKNKSGSSKETKSDGSTHDAEEDGSSD